MSGQYSCWCCDISGTVSTDEDVFAGQGSIFETVEEGTPAPATVEEAPAKPPQPAPVSESRAEMVEKEDAGGSA